jgi:putative endonuclease
MQPQTFFIYMVASIKGALYIGMTRNIATRIEQHKLGTVKGFSSKYRTNKLVWCEVAESFESAREREVELKGWRRSKKVDLIEVENPYWQDISSTVG